MNENQTFTSLDKAIAQTEKTIANIEAQMKMHVWFAYDPNKVRNDDLLKEQILQLTILDALQAKKRALKKDVLESYRRKEKRNRYHEYLLDWARGHQDPRNDWMHPASFGEWASSEVEE